MLGTDKQQQLGDLEKKKMLEELEFTVRHIVPACGSLFPTAVDRAQEADFVTWMQNLQDKSINRNEDQS